MFRNRGVTSKILVAGGVAALLATGVTGTASAWSGGDEAPLKVMTGFNGARSIAVGANDELYVPGYNNSTVAMFTAGWADGDTATNPGPAQVLTGGSGKSITARWVLPSMQTTLCTSDPPRALRCSTVGGNPMATMP